MNKLIASGFTRLWKDKIFWGCTVVMFAISVLAMWNGCRQATMDSMEEVNYALENYYFNIVPCIGLFAAVFSSLLIGTEYSDGTMRNKIIVGNPRKAVYLSNLLVVCAGAMIIMAASFLAGLVGIPVLGLWKIGVSGVLIYFLLISLMVAAICAILTFTEMMITNKAVSAVFALVLVIVLLLVASHYYNALCEPEMTSNAVLTTNGIQMEAPHPNPDYVSGMQRNIYGFLLDFLPTGQGILLANVEIVHPLRMSLCSIFIIIVLTGSGIVIFDKKDLK